MRMRMLFVTLLLASTTLGGCSAVRTAEDAVADVEQGTADTATYEISAAQADTIIQSAFREGWPDNEMQPLGGGRTGYQIRLWFMIDREHVIAEAIPSGSGYLFRVVNRGTAPAVGVPARRKMIQLLGKHAAAART